MIVGIDARVPAQTGRGWGRYTSGLVEALADTRALDLRILLPTTPFAAALAERVGAYPHVRVASMDFNPSSPDDYWAAAGGSRFEQIMGPVDLVHSPTRFILPTEVPCLVSTVHDIAPLSDPPFKPVYRDATLEALAFIRLRGVHLMTVSAFTRHELATRGGLDVSDVVVAHPGVSAVFRRQSEPDRRDGLLYVGGAGPNKNLDRLLDAVALLRNTHAVDLTLVGDRSWDHQELRRSLGADPPSWIRSIGYVTDGELADCYQRAAVCVVPSLHEGFGLPLLEAMAGGTPLACSRIPVFEEVAGDAAAYFDPLVTDDIVAAMRSLLDDRPLCRNLAALGRTRSHTFTWAETARKTIEVYRRALA